jgi:hypothetical protein
MHSSWLTLLLCLCLGFLLFTSVQLALVLGVRLRLFLLGLLLARGREAWRPLLWWRLCWRLLCVSHAGILGGGCNTLLLR